MERLTEKVYSNIVEVSGVGGNECRAVCEKVGNCVDCPISAAFNKLAEYEDLEEQGLLIRLPVKVGDTVYRISDKLHVRRKYIEKTKISRIAIDKDEIYVFCSCKPNAKRIFGVHVFQTAEEAEQKLKEMEESK